MYFKRKVYNELLEWKKTYSDCNLLEYLTQ